MNKEKQAAIDGSVFLTIIILVFNPLNIRSALLSPFTGTEPPIVKGKPIQTKQPIIPPVSAGEAAVDTRSRTLSVGGETIPIVQSKFIPKGTYTVGHPEWDPNGNEGKGRWHSPFLIVDWRSLPEENTVKDRARKLEQKTGRPHTVSMSIHGGNFSEGCVVLDQAKYDRLMHKFTGKTIVIR